MALVAGFALVVACGCAAPDPDTSSTGAGPSPPSAPVGSSTGPRRSALLFTRTEGFRHDSIGTATRALTTELGTRGFVVSATEDPAVFTAEGLADHEVVVFLMTTGDVLDDEHQQALQQWVEAGGGWVGVHAALDTEYEWPFYERLAGAWFRSHPAVQTATVRVEDADHPSTEGLGVTWSRSDEWYDLRSNPRDQVHVLLTVDESSYADGAMGADHPISWCGPVGDGASFVTAMGHTEESWTDPVFVGHVSAGIESVVRPGRCG